MSQKGAILTELFNMWTAKPGGGKTSELLSNVLNDVITIQYIYGAIQYMSAAPPGRSTVYPQRCHINIQKISF